LVYFDGSTVDFKVEGTFKCFVMFSGELISTEACGVLRSRNE
jgi:hypothetical protein